MIKFWASMIRSTSLRSGFSNAAINVNEPRFSNCFIEKRGSSYVESLEARGFPLFVASDLFFKIL